MSEFMRTNNRPANRPGTLHAMLIALVRGIAGYMYM